MVWFVVILSHIQHYLGQIRSDNIHLESVHTYYIVNNTIQLLPSVQTKLPSHKHTFCLFLLKVEAGSSSILSVLGMKKVKDKVLLRLGCYMCNFA